MGITPAESSSPFFSTPEMDRIFSIENQLRQMMHFEWALSGALEEAGLARAGSAAAMEPLLEAPFVDLPLLLAHGREAGNLAIPFVRQLTRALRERDRKAAECVHLGATSQDVQDTALVLQLREALGLLYAQIEELDRHLSHRVREHAHTILAGRTWLQAGPPTTLGLKIAGWLAALRRHRARLDDAAKRALVLQFGGAVGTLAALGERGTQVSAAIARKLDLPEPELPWHAHRDNLIELACTLGVLAGTLGKMARDVSLMMQTEVAEVFEPTAEGRGGSSTMPHKRNPVACAAILAVAARTPGLVSTLLGCMAQEHERGLGNWQAEWETIPEILRLTSAALNRSIEIAAGMQVSAPRMVENLASSRGLVMAEAVSAALAGFMGRERAHDLVRAATERAMAEDRPLRETLLEVQEIREHLSADQIDALLNPRNYLGSADRFIERVLGGRHADH